MLDERAGSFRPRRPRKGTAWLYVQGDGGPRSCGTGSQGGGAWRATSPIRSSILPPQHDNQSWVAALTVILDGALVLAGIDGISDSQARLTFAMARHAAVDLASTIGTPPEPPDPDRLPPADLEVMRVMLAGRGCHGDLQEAADAR